MNIKVDQTSSHDLICALWSETLSSAYQKMKMIDARHLPVINEAGQLVGLLSDRDVQRGMLAPQSDIAGHYPKIVIPDDALVSQFMSSPVATIDSNDSVTKAARIMADEKISALCVVHGNSLVGIVTSEDLLRLLVTVLEDEAHPIGRFVDRAGLKSSIGTVSHLLAQAGI